MDALDLLTADHRKVKFLFDQIQNSKGGQDKWRIFQNIKRELDLHSHVEETVFYPMFKRYDDTKDIVEQSYRDHQEVKSLLEAISKGGAQSEHFEGQIDELIENVDHHVEEEEHQLFPRIRRIMKKNEREILGRHIQQAKQEQMPAAA